MQLRREDSGFFLTRFRAFGEAKPFVTESDQYENQGEKPC